MLEPVANIKTLLLEGGCSPINHCHRVIAKQSLCQQLKKFMGESLHLAVSKPISDSKALTYSTVT